ncbi:MAG: hypothetical protein JKY34_06185 [Kordiimonadaceae bacterium]|nr:hypothetical protein [Kordiimonadaceae bacterium]
MAVDVPAGWSTDSRKLASASSEADCDLALIAADFSIFFMARSCVRSANETTLSANKYDLLDALSANKYDLLDALSANENDSFIEFRSVDTTLIVFLDFLPDVTLTLKALPAWVWVPAVCCVDDCFDFDSLPKSPIIYSLFFYTVQTPKGQWLELSSMDWIPPPLSQAARFDLLSPRRHSNYQN